MTGFDLKKLSRKFNEEDIEWRIQQSGDGRNGVWALIIPYITNRAIMKRLDDAVGQGNWKNEFQASPCNTGYMCGISIKIDGEWVTRWDGAEKSGGGIDNVKTTISNSMKRTGVQWGIGRYLYQFDASFAVTKPCDFRNNTLPGFNFAKQSSSVKNNFQWKAKPLDAWALPVTNKDIKARIDAITLATTEDEMKQIYKNSYKFAVSEDDDEMLNKFIKAKDNAKDKFEIEANKVKEVEKENLKKFIIDQTNIINATINESALEGITKLALQKVKLLSSGSELKEAMTAINSASLTKQNQLNGIK